MCPEAHKVSKRLRAPEEVEVEEEKKTLRLAGGKPVVQSSLGVPKAVGIPEKENYGVSQRPPSPILVGLFPLISQPCGMIVQSANLVDS